MTAGAGRSDALTRGYVGTRVKLVSPVGAHGVRPASAKGAHAVRPYRFLPSWTGMAVPAKSPPVGRALDRYSSDFFFRGRFAGGEIRASVPPYELRREPCESLYSCCA